MSQHPVLPPGAPAEQGAPAAEAASRMSLRRGHQQPQRGGPQHGTGAGAAGQLAPEQQRGELLRVAQSRVRAAQAALRLQAPCAEPCAAPPQRSAPQTKASQAALSADVAPRSCTGQAAVLRQHSVSTPVGRPLAAMTAAKSGASTGGASAAASSAELASRPGARDFRRSKAARAAQTPSAGVLAVAAAGVMSAPGNAALPTASSCPASDRGGNAGCDATQHVLRLPTGPVAVAEASMSGTAAATAAADGDPGVSGDSLAPAESTGRISQGAGGGGARQTAAGADSWRRHGGGGGGAMSQLLAGERWEDVVLPGESAP